MTVSSPMWGAVHIMSAALALPNYRFAHEPQTAIMPADCPPWWASDLFDADVLDRQVLRWESEKPIFGELSEPSAEANEWDAHWSRLQHSRMIGKLFSAYRRHIRARCVASYINRYFPAHGLFAECGCGSGETSCRLSSKRTAIAVDFSEIALRQALRFPCMHAGVLADLRELPFRDQSLDGLWNLGVMEHFSADEQLQILREFHRVLKPGGRMLLWWPPPYGLDHLVFRWFGGLFPAEPGRLNRAEVSGIAQAAGFDVLEVDFPITDALTELVLIAERRTS